MSIFLTYMNINLKNLLHGIPLYLHYITLYILSVLQIDLDVVELKLPDPTDTCNKYGEDKGRLDETVVDLDVSIMFNVLYNGEFKYDDLACISIISHLCCDMCAYILLIQDTNFPIN